MKTTKDMVNEPNFSDILLDLVGFLVWADQEDAMYGSDRASEALEALRLMLGYDQETFDKLKSIFVDNT